MFLSEGAKERAPHSERPGRAMNSLDHWGHSDSGPRKEKERKKRWKEEK